MRKAHRHSVSLLLMVIYLFIVVSPLAPLAMQSKLITRAVTGGCSGDCRVDGCSLERSAAHTCCCWQKKLTARTDSNATSSKTQQAENEAPKKVASCCAKFESEPTPPTAALNPKNTTVSSKSCGSGKLFALLSVEATYHIPFIFAGGLSSPEQSVLITTTPDRLKSRFGDPPDPPPIIA